MPQGNVMHPFIPDPTVKQFKFVTYKYIHGRNILFLFCGEGAEVHSQRDLQLRTLKTVQSILNSQLINILLNHLLYSLLNLNYIVFSLSTLCQGNGIWLRRAMYHSRLCKYCTYIGLLHWRSSLHSPLSRIGRNLPRVRNLKMRERLTQCLACHTYNIRLVLAIKSVPNMHSTLKSAWQPKFPVIKNLL